MSKFLEALEKQFSTANFADYVIEIGVVDANTRRKQILSVGLTNAEVLYINEHGSPINKLPARPVLHMTLDWAQSSGLIKDTLHKCVEGVLKKDWHQVDIEKELNRMCMRMENYCKDLIMSNDGRLAPNAPSVAKAKWKKEKHSASDTWSYPAGNHPLFDTGQLVGSITCRCVKKDL